MTEPDDTGAVDSRAPWPIIAAALGLAAILLGALAIYLYQSNKAPANDSADVGFARDMSIHHQQAVEMANIAYRRTQDPEIERIALDIATTQQFQIGMMTGWLDIWGRSVSSDQPLMGWMGNYDMTLPSPPPGLEAGDSMAGMDMDHSATPAPGDTTGDSAETPLMPGMATRSQVDELNTLPPDQMDIRFLQLMIRHHQGGVMMAQAALEKAGDENVLNFAQQVIDTQDAEIETMTSMLNERLAVEGSATPEAGAPGTPGAGTPEADMSGMPGMASPAATHAGH
jgi:uncharacterized protein (DUF305 family)